MATLLGVEISRGSIGRLRQQVSAAIAEPVKQAQEYVILNPLGKGNV